MLVGPAICLAIGAQFAPAAEEQRTDESAQTAQAQERVQGAPASTVTGEARQRGAILEEVLVTARKRGESLRDIPVAVTALTATQLEKSNIQSGEDLFGQVPGLYGATLGPGNVNTTERRFTIRGVGARAPLETSVAVFVDGVYMPTVGWDMDFLEVERVETLRGPQGALFGRNTQAGAISIVTRQPQREFGGHVRVNFDEFDTARGDVYLTGSVTENLLFSATGLAEQTDGYIENVTLGEDALEREKYGGRVALRFEPSERFDATFYADGVFQEGGFYGNGEPLEGQSNRIGDHEVVYDQAPFEDLDNYGASININFNADFATLTSITGWRRISALSLSDRDDINTPDRDGQGPINIPSSILEDADFPPPSGNYIVIGREQSLISQELRLASKSPGRLQWLIGVYGFDEENDRTREQRMADCFVNPNPAAQSCVPNPMNHVSDAVAQDRDGYAVFGQASYDLTDRLELTLGGRYTAEKDKQDLAINFFSDNRFGSDTAANFTGNPQTEFADFTPSGSLNYRWNDDLITYLSVAEGFKGGGFSPQGVAFPQVNLAFDSETSLVYELGAKSSWFDQRLTLDAALYWIETTDMQVTTVLIIPGTTIASGATTNAGKARSKGFELEMAAVPTQGLRLRGAVGYIEAVYEEYIVDPRLTPSGVPVLDLSGEPIEEIPDWTVNFSADYTFPISADRDMTFGALYGYIGSMRQGSGTPQSAHIRVDGYDSTDVRVALSANRWDVTLYAQNLFDEYNVSNKVNNVDAFRTPGLFGVQRAEPPRRVGLRATYRF